MGPTAAPRQALNPVWRAILSTLDLTTISFHPIKQRQFLPHQSITLHTTTTASASDWNTREETR